MSTTIPLILRLQHFTWAWFTLTMSTGGLSLLVMAQHYQFPGLRETGLGLYFANIALFITICAGLFARFFMYPGTLKQSLTHPREGFFVPTALLSFATIITGTERNFGPQHPDGLLLAIQVCFWCYTATSTVVAVAQYAFVFSPHRLPPLRRMMPTWLLPIFPVMLSGTIASVIADTQPDMSAVPIITAGLTCQGLGLWVTLIMYAPMAGRLFSSGLPDREHRPGLFMCVGPQAFTALALVGMANGLPETFDPNFDGVPDTGMLRILTLVCVVFLWTLSFWWFGIAALAVAAAPPRSFHLGWWAAIFPNIGFTLATISLGKTMRSEAILGIATVMSILVALAYVFVLGCLIRAVAVQQIMYPGRDEDVDEGSSSATEPVARHSTEEVDLHSRRIDYYA